MKKLLDKTNIGGRVEYTWLHVGDDGRDKFTTETVQDVAPIIKDVETRAKADKGKDFRFVASIPMTLIEEAARLNAAEWGISKADALREITSGKTDRAKSVWRTFTTGRDFRKLQAKPWR